MKIKVLPEPGGCSGGESVLDPAGHGISLQRTIARSRHAVLSEKLLCKFLVLADLVPESIQVAKPLVKMVSDVRRPIAELGIKVVVVITFPRGQEAIISSPDRLERDGVGILPRRRPELVHFPVVLALDKSVRNLNVRLPPIGVPVLQMTFVSLRRPFGDSL